AHHRAEPPTSATARGLWRHCFRDRARLCQESDLRLLAPAVVRAQRAVPGCQPGFALLRGDRRAGGIRATHGASIPLDLPRHSPAGSFAAVRKSLFALTVIPIWVASTVLYFAIWPGRPALEHVAILVAIGTLLVHRSLYGFRKIPFACSYLPGRANLQVRLGA